MKMPTTPLFVRLFFAIAFSASGIVPAVASIEQLLLKKVPVPTQRPEVRPSLNGFLATPSTQPDLSPVSGSLKDGLDALSKRDAKRAMQIRFGMSAGSLDRKILAWAIALSGQDNITSAQITDIVNDLRDWPAQKAMIANAEKAFADERHAPQLVVEAFSGQTPETVEGALKLANSFLALSNKQKARQTILTFWLNERFNAKTEKQILDDLGTILTVKDHRHRMHQLFHNGHIEEAKRMGSLAEQFSLARAWGAVLQNSSKAKAMINAVAPASRKDPAFTFVQIEHARRTGKYREASNLLLKYPEDNKTVDPDDWWNERRIVSRQMLELGDAATAYRLAAGHFAVSTAAIAEAEFHAGWYALRYSKDATTARRHFQKLLDVTSQPISQARAFYWLGRSNSGEVSKNFFRKAAYYSGTYYGQLAAVELGIKKLDVSRPKPTDAERERFSSRELVQAIKRLESIDYGWRADSIYRHLAQTLNSAGELAILAARAEEKGNNKLSLQIGKLANARGLEVDTLAWPIGAIPNSAKPGRTGLALAYAIARQESAFDVAARSSADARGLLQLLPGTAKSVAGRNQITYSRSRLTSDAGYNVTLGSAYLAEQLAEFGGSYILTFAAYNAGPRRAREWIARFGDPRSKKLHDVIDWVELIPFTETRNYVQRVMENYQVYKNRLENSTLEIAKDLARGRH